MTRLDEALAPLAGGLDRALADGLRELSSASRWSPFELEASLRDLLSLSDCGDACYDRPSSGWAYAAWYHGRRTHAALRILAPSLLDRPGDVVVIDLGCGTGATLWALAALRVAATRASVDLPTIRVVAIDASQPMLEAAEALWETLLGDASLGDQAARVGVRFELASWTDAARLQLPEADAGIVLGSYLFDHSDQDAGGAVGRLLADATNAIGAAELLIVGSSGKSSVIDAGSEAFSVAGWRDTAPQPLDSTWTGPLDDVARHRAAVYRPVSLFDRFPRDPSWTDAREQPCFYRYVPSAPDDRLFRPERRLGFALDDHQDEVAQPDKRSTVIVGAAGSGKSRILVERAVRTLEAQRPGDRPVSMLIATFNTEMVELLVTWARERLADSSLRHWVHRVDRGDHSFAAPDEPRGACLRLMTWDKIPSRIFDVTPGTPRNITAGDVEQRLHQLGTDYSRLTEAQRRVLEPAFLEVELRRVIYGLRVWEERQAYLDVERRGRRTVISTQQKELVWDIAYVGGTRTWTHYRIEGLETARRRAGGGAAAAPFTDLMLDECQDLTPADFELATLLVPDPSQILVTGDEAQALHLGASYQRPGQLVIPEPYRDDGQPAFRLWQSHKLLGSYRLPVRVCECLLPIAKRLEQDRRERGGEHDVGLPEAKKPAVLGVRPIVVSADNAVTAIGEVFATYSRLLMSAPSAAREITIAEGGLDEDSIRRVAPSDYDVAVRWMRQIKGLERACIIWSTAQPAPTQESELEWIYTVLTRTTGLAVIVVASESTTPAAAEALSLLRRDRLLVWDPAAELALGRALEQRSTS
jgi:DNA helicase-2/ATP-dependent DNA helicase PcrA